MNSPPAQHRSVTIPLLKDASTSNELAAMPCPLHPLVSTPTAVVRLSAAGLYLRPPESSLQYLCLISAHPIKQKCKLHSRSARLESEVGNLLY